MVNEQDFEDLKESFDRYKKVVDTLLVNLLQPALDVPGTLRFGGNVMQLDRNGIQVKADTASTTLITFTKDLVAEPGSETTRGQISSQVSDSAVNMSFAAARATGNLVQLYMTEAAATGSVAQFIGSTSMAIQLFPGADPPVLADGYIWYNESTDKLYARANGVTYQLAPAAGGVATDTIWDAKGDLAVGTALNTAQVLSVGADGTVLTADSAQTTGIKWAAAAAGSFSYGKAITTSQGQNLP